MLASAAALPAPLAHLPLDDLGDVAADISGSGYHGDLGQDVLRGAPGRLGRAVTTVAPGGASGQSSDGVLVHGLGVGQRFDEASVAFWYRLADAHDGYLLHWGGSYRDPSSISIYLDVSDGLRVRVHAEDETHSVELVTPPGFADGDWHHLAVVKDAAGSRVYFDGVFIRQSGMGAGSIEPPIGAGLGINESGRWGAAADFDDVRFFAAALAESDVAELANAQASPPDAAGPMLHLDMEQVSQPLAFDASGWSHHAELGSDTAAATGFEGAARRTTAPGGNSGSAADGVWVPGLGVGHSFDEATVAFWYRPADVHNGYLFHWGGSYHRPDTISIYFNVETGLRLRVHDSGDAYSSLDITPPGFADGAWHHLAVVKDATGTRAFFDGAQVASHPMGAGSFQPPLGVGLGVNEFGRWGAEADFDGVQIFDRALDAGEIAALYGGEQTGSDAVGNNATGNNDTGGDSGGGGSNDSGTGGGDSAGGSNDSGTGDGDSAGGGSNDSGTGSGDGGNSTENTGDGTENAGGESGPFLDLGLDTASGTTGFLPATEQVGALVAVGLDGVVGSAMQTAGDGRGGDTLDASIYLADFGDDAYGAVSVAFWYRLPAEAHDGYLFSWGGAVGEADSISVWMDHGNELRVRVHDADDTSSVIHTAPAGFDDAAWHLLAVVKDNSGSRVYFDGAEVAQSAAGAGTISPPTGPTLSGRPNGSYGIEATFDQLRLWDRALGAQEIADLYAAEKPAGDFGHYRSNAEILADLVAVEASYPEIVELVDFGDSYARTIGGLTLPNGDLVEGDDLVAVRVTRRDLPAGDPAVGKPVFVLMACLHAREIATPEMALRFLDWLTGEYGADPDATFIVDHHEVWILPMVNPDGHRVVELGALAENGGVPWRWRKNTRNAGSCNWPPEDSGSGSGVDLNRNFPVGWGEGYGRTGSDSECSAYHRGSGPASEPETQAIVSLLSSLFADQRGPGLSDAAPEDTSGLFVQLHSPYRTVVWPWAHRHDPAPNEAGLAAVGGKLAALAGYGSGQAVDEVYRMSGTADDWVYGELGVASLLFELGESLMPPYGRIDRVLWPEVRGSLIYAAKMARAPYLEARGPQVRDVSVTVSGGFAQVEATADDAGSGGETVIAVEAFLGQPPWQGGQAQALDPLDGSFDASLEPAAGQLDLAGLESGRHLLYVQAVDASGHRGAVTAAWLDVP